MIDNVTYALMAGNAYISTRPNINQFPVPQGWIEFNHRALNSGFEAVTFTNGSEIIISYAGTGPGLSDWDANSGLALGFGSDQLRQAAVYYLEVKTANPGATISFTGHSLGGGLAALMGVFFDEKAVTFDQAPFAASASIAIRDDLHAYLNGHGYSDSVLATLAPELLSFDPYASDDNPALDRLHNITGYFVQGEILQALQPAVGVLGNQTQLTQSSTGLGLIKGPIDLHSQALLSAFLQNDSFRAITFKLPELLKMVFDEALYSRDPSDKENPQRNFLEHLVCHQSGVTGSFAADAMLDRFTADLLKVAQDGGFTLTNAHITNTLVAFAMQKYYEEPASGADHGQALFTDVSGGIRFDRTDVAANLSDVKGWNLYFQNYLNTLTLEEHRIVLQLLPAATDWFIQAGNVSMNATAEDKKAFMLGGIGDDILTGGSETDLLIGNDGADTLYGGFGNDILLGGQGFDTYRIFANEGLDTIEDGDGQGQIFLDNTLLEGGHRLADNLWQSADKHHTYRLTGDTLSIDASIYIEHFHDGDLGLHLAAAPTPADTAQRTLTAQSEFHWSRTAYDALEGHGRITQANVASRIDAGAGNDLVMGEGTYRWGNFGLGELAMGQTVTIADTLYGEAGNDWLAGNTGNDRLDGGTGNDVLIGGNGADVLEGGDGNDTLFGLGENTYRFIALRADGRAINGNETLALWQTWGSDFRVDAPALRYDGSTGLYWINDFPRLPGATAGEMLRVQYNGTGYDLGFAIYSNEVGATPPDSATDILLGGAGNDILEGDAGDDHLDGGADHDWLLGNGGRDLLDGGAGNDQLIAGAGVDLVLGGEGNDVAYGESGDDLLDGGAGNDTLQGDSEVLAGQYHGDDNLDGGDGGDLMAGQGGADTLLGGAGDDELQGDSTRLAGQYHSNDSLDGGDGHDRLFGMGGSDVLLGGEGNDTLDGGQGNDLLQGGMGDDTYVFNRGDGVDTLTEVSGSDSLRLGAGIRAADVTIAQTGQDMDIRIGAEGVVVAGGFNAAERRIERIVFDNGAIWSQAEITLRGRVGTSLAQLQADPEGLAALASLYPRIYGLLIPPGIPSLGWPLNSRYSLPGDIALRFGDAQTFVPRRDPLTLDLDGDGLESLGIDPARPLLFDHDGDGVKTASGWIKPDDGFLVLDRNGNGLIDNGRELFGDSTPLASGGRAADGFAALAREDGNGDGTIDAADPHFADLRVWRDLNQDGVSQAGELKTLAETGIASISTTRTANSQVLNNGNRIADLGGFTWVDGHQGGLGAITGQAGDIDLADNPFYSRFGDAIPLTEQAANLPEMAGSGLVRGLREAASLSPNLAVNLADYAAAATREARLAKLDSLLAAWAATSTMKTTANGAYAGHPLSVGFAGIQVGTAAYTAWMDKLSLLERFNGQTFRPVPAGNAAVSVNLDSAQMSLLEQSYTTLKTSVYQGLLLQTRFSEALGAIGLKAEAGALRLDFTGLETVLAGKEGWEGLADISEFVHLTKDALVPEGWDGNAFLWQELRDFGDPTLTRQSEAATGKTIDIALLTAGGALPGTQAGDWLIGGTGADTLDGLAGNDMLYGREGVDTLQGSDGDDILAGGTGNDALIGGYGSDTYEFNLGDGVDTIYEVYGYSYTDILKFGADITPGDITARRNGLNLELAHANGVDKVVVSNWFASTNGQYQLDRVEFAPSAGSAQTGSQWSAAQLTTPLLALTGTAGNDTITGGGYAETLRGLEGNDTLNGEQGDDRLEGGTGNDTLNGDYGNDTYEFNLGDGVDTINESEASTTSDVLRFGVGIRAEDISVVRNGGSLELRHANGRDKVVLANWYPTCNFSGHLFGWLSRTNNDPYRLERVEFAPSASSGLAGVQWTKSELTSLGFALTGTAGNDTLSGGDFDESLHGRAGNDTLNGGYGNDTYEFNLGDGVDTINETGGDYYTDALQFGASIMPGDITARRRGQNLELAHVNGVDKVIVGNWFANGGGINQLDRVAFADGSQWGATQLTTPWLTLTGTAGIDTLVAGGYNEALWGLAGNDTLEGGRGNNTLAGGAGNDILTGEGGDDTLTGGTGNDILTGGHGCDTYEFNLGDGVDTINEIGGYLYDEPWSFDILKFGAGIRPGDITVRRNGQNLLFTHVNGVDKVTVTNWFAEANGNNELDRVDFAPSAGSGQAGSQWTATQLTNQCLTLTGTAGNDAIVGGGYNETLRGLAGNDTLNGSYGSDAYEFNLGDGVDTINEINSVRTSDILKFGAGIRPGDITTRRTGLNLELAHVNGRDRVVINNWFNCDNSYYRLDRVEFADGSLWSEAQLTTPWLTLTGTTGNDTLTVTGYASHTLKGQAGNDVLKGGTGNDILVGGKGNDVLDGGGNYYNGGADTYLFDLGDGMDTIKEYSADGSTDILKLGAGISYEQLWFKRSGNNLEASVIGTADKITIQNWYASHTNHVERFEAGGRALLDSRVDLLVQAMAAFAPPAAGQSTLPDNYRQALAPVLAANWQ